MQAYHIASNFRKVWLFSVEIIFRKLNSMTNALGKDNAKLGQLRPQHVDRLCPLPDNKITGPMNREYCLLFRCLHFNKPHCWASDCFADGCSINSI